MLAAADLFKNRAKCSLKIQELDPIQTSIVDAQNWT